MAELEIIEQFLNINTDNKRLRDGKRKPNKNQYYYYTNQFYIIKLTQNKWVIANDDSTTRRLLRRYTWYFCPEGYAATRIGNILKRWHQLYLSYEQPSVADHINNRRYDNRSDNLRVVQHRENMRNKTKYKNNKSGKMGVSRWVGRGMAYWKVHIRDPEGKQIAKYFSINKLGEELAKKQAIEKRVELERLYGYIGD
jgi:hypothetical protein